MHITSGLSPVSGELLDPSINFYGDAGDQCGTAYFAIDHTVPESSHTVEIEYIYDQPQTYNLQTDIELNVPDQTTPAQKKDVSKKTNTKHKPEQMAVDDSEGDLTNLTWLQNITNIMQVPQFPFPINPSSQVKPPQPQSTRLEKFNKTIAKCQKDFTENKDEYRTNQEKKPPYSYSTIICMAMRYNNDKMTLSAIYSWIKDNFKYYRKADPTWQVSYQLINGSRISCDLIKGPFRRLDYA